MSASVASFDDLPTPALLLDRGIFERNCKTMQRRARAAGVKLRPHMKTAKSLEAYREATKGGFGGITVSTLAEADYFARGGVTDILYAVGIVPAKLAGAKAIQEKGAAITLITDNLSVVPALNEEAGRLNTIFPVMIEIDCGGRRGGVLPDSSDLTALGRALEEAEHLELAGVMTHAGQSYHCATPEQIAVVAEDERQAVVGAAERLEAAGLPCPVVSAGSTPTAVHARSFEGLTEIRPGVYMFGDVDQMYIGSCSREDIAVTVLASVIGHNRAAGRILIDAGGLALSKDTSASEFTAHAGYGLVCDLEGQPIDALYVESVHQEHGLIAAPEGVGLPYERLPVGSRLRILPIHACMTVAAYEHYELHDGKGGLLGRWDRVNRW